MSQVEHKSERAKSGWADDEVRLLWDEVHSANITGTPLKIVFDRLAEKTNRKPNSVRNFYYASLKMEPNGQLKRRPLPFVSFQESEVRQLMRDVLTARASGQSVRACVHRLSGGDQQLMLRLQNKYRSTLKSKPELVRDVLRELEADRSGVAIPLASPPSQQPQAAAQSQPDAPLLRDLNVLGDAEGAQFYASLRALCKMAGARAETRTRLEEIDRLKVRVDYLRMDIARHEEEAAALRERIADAEDAYASLASLVATLINASPKSRDAAFSRFAKEARALISPAPNGA